VQAALEEFPKLMAAIRQVVQRGDATQLRLPAHTLKGSLQYFAATQAIDHACQLEALGKAGSLQGAREILATLETEIRAVNAALQAYMQSGQSK
jgi:HPt (histidine-containing phosphotransfer) domain-containing protein